MVANELHEVDGVELFEALLLPAGVERRLQEVGVVDAGDLDRVLERHEDALAGALVGRHVEQILAFVEDLAAGDLVARMTGQRARERALARSVGPHDGVDFALVRPTRLTPRRISLSSARTFKFRTSSIFTPT